MRLKRIVSKAVALGLSCSLLVPPGPVLADTAASAALAPAAQAQPQRFPLVQLPPGFQIEKVAEGLTYLSGITFDDQGRLYVLEAGGAFLDLPAPARILRVEPGRVTEIANLTATGIAPSAVGITWHNGAFLVTHRDDQDRTGAVSRVTLDGQRTQLFSGIVDSQAEHQVNDIKIGPDGMAYLAVGPASNAGIVGIDLAPFYKRSPTLQHRPCQDIVLT
ncbi:MAG TPA: sugar dehydrogenase, partial [Chloroflexota bacterium]|nr:sugar dehydrogenase [Chloroflexota bacterium]